MPYPVDGELLDRLRLLKRVGSPAQIRTGVPESRVRDDGPLHHRAMNHVN